MKLGNWLTLSLVSALIAPVITHAQRADTMATTVVTDGVTHARFVRNDGPWIVNVVRVDLRSPSLQLRHVRANESVFSRERVSDMVRRRERAGDSVFVAINADFFDLSSGANENNQMIDGEWWRGLPVTDSPFDTFDNIHSQFALDSRQRPMLERFSFGGSVIARGRSARIRALNSPAPADSGYGAIHLFTDRFGTVTPSWATRDRVELPLRRAGQRGDTILYLSDARALNAASAGTAIPFRGAVLAGYGNSVADVAALASSDTLLIVMTPDPFPAPGGTRAPLALIVGGWPRIIRDGVNIALRSDIEEGTIERNAGMRHPRSAIGFSRDSTTLFLMTVDGRSSASIGMTIVELADLMLELGVYQALNFDGGGSTTLVISGRIANSPADAGAERPVGNAILVTRRGRESPDP